MKILKDDIPDKHKFLVDMLELSAHENFEISRALSEQSDILEELADIARKIGSIKQSANGEISNLADKYEIKWKTTNPEKEYKILKIYD